MNTKSEIAYSSYMSSTRHVLQRSAVSLRSDRTIHIWIWAEDSFRQIQANTCVSGIGGPYFAIGVEEHAADAFVPTESNSVK